MSLRIARMRIDRFGPLVGLDLTLGSLTVVVGDNESGKSSIVDALHAWLRRSFRRTNAVSWDGVRRSVPGYDGQVEIELASESGGALPTRLCDEPVLWNLLVIPEGRAGMRRIGMTQRDWLVEAKPHLTGFDAEAIRGRLRERAGLTPTDRDSREWAEEEERLARRQSAIEAFLDGLGSLGPREAELRARSEELRRLEDEAAREREAVDRLPWRRAAAAQETVDRSTDELAELGPGSEDDLRAWRGLELELGRQAARQRDARLARGRAEERRIAADADLARAESARADAEGRVAQVAEAGLAHRIAEVERSTDTAEGTRRLSRASVVALLLGVALLAIGIAGPGWLSVAGVGILSAGGVLLVAARSSTATRAARRNRLSTILEDARRLGLPGRDLAALARGLADRDDRLLRERVSVEAARIRAADAVERRDELVGEEAAAERGFALAEERIRELQRRCDLPSAEALAERIERRIRLEAERERARGELEALLPGRPDTERHRAIDEHRDGDSGHAPTPGALARLERALVESRAAVAVLERETAGAMERGLQAIDQPDLAAARAALDETYRVRAERALHREATRLALRVVEEAERDVDGHLDRAFADPAFGAGAIFARLTRGRWAGIRRTESTLDAILADGSSVPVEGLSRGTHDQLHVALRAALARRVLGEPGFFVWDDTFLTADPERRRALVEAAVDLVADGWQIVYLTVDPSIADLFAAEAATRGSIDCRVLTLERRRG